MDPLCLKKDMLKYAKKLIIQEKKAELINLHSLSWAVYFYQLIHQGLRINQLWASEEDAWIPGALG